VVEEKTHVVCGLPTTGVLDNYLHKQIIPKPFKLLANYFVLSHLISYIVC
jgi:hypothetical protein